MEIITYEVQEQAFSTDKWKAASLEVEDINKARRTKRAFQIDYPGIFCRIVRKTLTTEVISEWDESLIFKEIQGYLDNKMR